MNIIRTTALATLLALGTAAAGAGAAQAQAVTEADIATYVPSQVGNVVGGGAAALTGGGDNLVIRYGATGTAQPGRSARIVTDSGEPQVEYLEPAPAGRGRAAMLIGGGDNATVVYSDIVARPGRG